MAKKRKNDNKQGGNMTVIAGIMAIIIAGGIWFFVFKDGGSLGIGNDTGSDIPAWGEVTFDFGQGESTSETEGDVSSSEGPAASVDAQSAIANWNTFNHTQRRFSFRYPPEFTIGQFPEGEDGESIVVQNAAKRQGFQIYIVPVDEDIVFTKKRILQDIPDITVDDPQPVNIGANGQGIAFLSDNETFGRSREVWFTFNGYLYQISTYESLDNLLQTMFGTWEFN